MLDRIIRFSLLNRVVILVLAAVITIAGCVVLTRSEIDIFPDLNAPTVVVMTEAHDRLKWCQAHPLLKFDRILGGLGGV